MSDRLLMLDSGAFTAWTKGKRVDLNAYIDFCLEHPSVNYYVNLDVIPGSYGSSVVGTREVEVACEQGWDNYQRMIERLPPDKVIPVFHCGEPVRFLKRMLDNGVKYLGLGGMVGNTRQSNRRWIDSLKSILLRGGRPVVKVHGFGLTGIKLLRMFPWYSVDSATWVKVGGNGLIYVPVLRSGRFVYGERLYSVAVSDSSPQRGEFDFHILSLPPRVQELVDCYLRDIGLIYGSSSLVNVPEGYKLKPGSERWERKGKSIWRVIEKGITSCDQRRKYANAIFFQRLGDELGIRLYLAGEGVLPFIEKKIRRRLMTYASVPRGAANRAFLYHCEHTTKEKSYASET